jgi:hypothetical protein
MDGTTYAALSGVLPDGSISRQLLEIEYGLAGQAGTTAVLELSNGSPEPATVATRRPRPATGPPRLVNGRRSKFDVLAAFPSANGRLLYGWCPTEQKWHAHGRHGHPDTCRRLLRGAECGCRLHDDLHGFRGPCTCPPGAGDSHRKAHCTDPRSPWKQDGYEVREVRP